MSIQAARDLAQALQKVDKEGNVNDWLDTQCRLCYEDIDSTFKELVKAVRKEHVHIGEGLLLTVSDKMYMKWYRATLPSEFLSTTTIRRKFTMSLAAAKEYYLEEVIAFGSAKSMIMNRIKNDNVREEVFHWANEIRKKHEDTANYSTNRMVLQVCADLKAWNNFHRVKKQRMIEIIERHRERAVYRRMADKQEQEFIRNSEWGAW